MKKLIWIIILVLILAGVWWWGGRTNIPTGAEDGPIKVGFIAALTGVGSAIGNEELQGTRLAVENINAAGGVSGRPIELIAEDLSLDKMRVAGSVAQKLINIDKVVAIVGPQWDEPTLAIAPIIEENKIPTVSHNLTPIAEQGTNNEYLFSVWPSNEIGVQELLRFAKDQGLFRIAIIQPGNFGFWELVSGYFIKHAPTYRITVVHQDSGTDLSNADYRTLILKAKSADPDAIFGTFAEFECPFLRQATELELNVPLLSTESAGTPDALKDCPNLLEGKLYFSTPARAEKYDSFAADFKKQFGNEPQFPSAVTAYDAVYVIADALERAENLEGEQIKNALNKTDLSGISLPEIIFDDRGYVRTPVDAFEVQTVKAGKFVKAE